MRNIQHYGVRHGQNRIDLKNFYRILFPTNHRFECSGGKYLSSTFPRLSLSQTTLPPLPRLRVGAEQFLSAGPPVPHGCSPSGECLLQRGSPTVEVLELGKLLTPVLEPCGIGCDQPGAVHALLPHWAPLQLPVLKAVQAQYRQLFLSLFFCYSHLVEFQKIQLGN